MYRKMGSEFLGTYVRHDIVHTGHDPKYIPMLSHDQVIRRIRCFMSQRDKSEKTDVSFYDEGSKDNFFQVKACKCLTMKKMFAPPFGVLPGGGDARVRETKPVQVKAGFEFGETSGSHTLWVVKGAAGTVDLRNEYVLSPYHDTC